MPYANFGLRLGAFIIDSIIVGAMWLPGRIFLQVGPSEITDCPDGFGNGQFDLCEVPTGGTWAITLVLWAAAFAGTLAYFGILEGQRGQTIGKKVLNLRTQDAVTGEVIGTGRAIGRYFARILSAIPCYLGYLWMLWDDKNQTWQDKIVSSVVVKVG